MRHKKIEAMFLVTHDMHQLLLGPQFVDTLFIGRLRPNMSIRHAVINY